MAIANLMDPLGQVKRRSKRMKLAQKLAVGMGVAVTISVATGILVAAKSGQGMRKYLKKRTGKTEENIPDISETKAEEGVGQGCA